MMQLRRKKGFTVSNFKTELLATNTADGTDL